MSGLGYRKQLRRAAAVIGSVLLLSLAFLYNIRTNLNPTAFLTTVIQAAIERNASTADSSIFLNGTTRLWERGNLVLTQAWTKNVTSHKADGDENGNETLFDLRISEQHGSLPSSQWNNNITRDGVADNLNETMNSSSQRLWERGSWAKGPLTENITTPSNETHDPSKIVTIVPTESTRPKAGEPTSHDVNDNAVPSYSQKDILRVLRNESFWFTKYHLLVFENGQFYVYTLFNIRAQMSSCKCVFHVMEAIVDGLVTARPQRFNSSSTQPWQGLLDITRDNVYYPCMDKDEGCASDNSNHPYPPIITIASVPRQAKSLLPFLVQLPTIYYNDCIYKMRVRHHGNRPGRPCSLQVQVQTLAAFTDQVWESLTPQVFWRGTDLSTVPEKGVDYRPCKSFFPRPGRGNLTWTQVAEFAFRTEQWLIPRCRAAILSAKVQEEWLLASSLNDTLESNTSRIGNNKSVPWLNVKFGGFSRDHIRYVALGYGALVDNYTSPSDMSKYKYQIDFGGAGGTTWLGTITKLAMPGLLFHHETPTKDFFHDELQPWVHYVPIHTNVSNLHDMFLWAETHPEEAKRIAQRGQEYAREHVSTRQLEATFETAYVNRFGPIVDAYEPMTGGETMSSILQEYESMGFNASLLATCHPQSDCHFFMRPVN